MDGQNQTAPAKTGKMGCGTMILIITILVMFVAVAGNEAFGYILSHCGDDDIIFCLLGRVDESEPQGAVVATGVYTYKDYSVTVTANIPLEGGAVTGSMSGTCAGKLKGTFTGQNNGAFSGTIVGSCSPFFFNVPVSATFSGTVNKDAKNAPISFIGKGAGITHNGSLFLAY